MPQPNYPPPTNEGGAIIEPRQLFRWLDINPQGGPLTRIRKYLILPAFHTAVDIYIPFYSSIFISIACEAPNNFSIQNKNWWPTAPSYFLVIMYTNEDNTVVRYKFWDNIGEVIFFDIPFYNGQKIKKNFRWEIWSIDNDPLLVENPADITIDTSVLGDYDYRYKDDILLADNDNTNFDFTSETVINKMSNIPIVWPTPSVPILNS